MNRNSLTTAVIAGIAGVAGIASMANAVNLNPDGLGQVLLYPYYTVNSGQNTLLSVVNTTAVGKAVKVRFLEGYNSREVLDFNLFLSPFDVWTAGVFALSDAGVGTTGTSDGAAILTYDNSCTAPSLDESTSPGGLKYVAFRTYAYGNDGGPATADRTREGHFEMIAMGDIDPASALAADITHVNSVPPDCGSAQGDAAGSLNVPTSGLFGAASVVNVANGTYYAYNADALEGFTSTTLLSDTSSLTPGLAQVNDAGSPTTVSAFVFNNGSVVEADYDQATQAIDAVSAVFDASNLYNEWQAASDGSVGSDWVVTFPTKRYYVDKLYTGTTAAIPPFEEGFSEVTDGLSCDVVGINLYDREENTTTQTTCGFSPCPPGQPPSSLCHETNVITFGGSSILGSGLTSNIAPIGSNGWLSLSFTDSTHGGTAPATDMHAMNPDLNGTVFYGLPVTGFEAVNFINNDVGGVLANYSGVNRHRSSRCADTTLLAGACS